MMSKYLIKNYPDFTALQRKSLRGGTGGDPITREIETHYFIKKLVLTVLNWLFGCRKISLASSMKREERRLISVASGLNKSTNLQAQNTKLGLEIQKLLKYQNKINNF